ncbi:hypothetical protein [Zhihengliuella sp.]|uniref:hypothetical protein n=1 Tax=Zhihengliuella sp. TaxID=1954483 RepID=UPI002811C26B|nr:hypothetical protein [Zhihengliuella sp.]
MAAQRTILSLVAAPVACLGLLLAGCAAPATQSEDPPASAGSEESPPDGQDTDSADAPAPSDGGGQDGGGDGGDASAAPLGDLGTRDVGAFDDATMTLNSVRADAGTMTVTFTLTNHGDSNEIVTQEFSNGVKDATDNAAASMDTWSVDGVFVVTAEGQRYLVGRGDDGVCACSVNINSGSIGPGRSTTYSAVFAAPPEEVNEVDVHIPQVGAFEAVEIGRR